jgi:hypothetical protein
MFVWGGAFELLEKLVEGVCIVDFYNIYLSSLHIKYHKCSSKLPLFISFSCLFYYCISSDFFVYFYPSVHIYIRFLDTQMNISDIHNMVSESKLGLGFPLLP